MSDDKTTPAALRVRSPNYPAFGLQSALEQTERLFKKIHKHPAPRDVVVTGLGYTSYNGASAGALSAQLKYGLLIKIGEDYKVSDRSIAIIHPRNTSEKAAAIHGAAFSPSLFSELAKQFQGHIPDDSLLRSTLIRKGFGVSAVAPFIQAFRETMELVARESAQYDSVQELDRPEEAMLVEAVQDRVILPTRPTSPATTGVVLDDDEREMLHGPLSRTVSYRLVMRGEAGPKDLGKLIKILQLQKTILEDDDEDASEAGN